MATALSEYIPLGEVPNYLPRRGGRKPSKATVYRWASSGTHGVKLQTVLVGGFRYTSAAALEEFVAAVTAARDGQPVAPGPRRQADVARRLDHIGV